MKYNNFIKILLATITICIFSKNGISQNSIFGANNQHLGYYNAEFSSNFLLSKKWTFKTNNRIFSSAAISENVVFFGSDDSCFYAINIDGSLKWKFKSNGPIRSTAAIKDTLVYFHNYGSTFYSLDTRTGDKIWSFKTDSEMVNTKTGINGLLPANQMIEDDWDMYQSSPVYTDSIAYFGSGENFYALNLINGKLIWKYRAPLVIHSSPALYNGVVYFGCWDSKLYALDARTGAEKWIYSTGTDAGHLMEGIQSSPTIVDTFVFIASRDANVYAINSKTGKLIWETSFGGSWMPSSFALLNDTLYTGSSDARGFFALDKITGQIKYKLNLNCYVFSTPAVTNNIAFIGSQNGSVFVINLKSQKIISRFDTDGRKNNFLNAILDDGSINPDVFNPVSTAKPEDSKEFLKRLYSAGSVLSSPVIYNNVVYFGSTDSCIYAVYDAGNCSPQFTVSESKIDLGEKMPDSKLDTSFTITNTAECSDSFDIILQYASTLNNGAILETSNVLLNAKESKKINIKFDFSKMKTKTYKGAIKLKSKTNEYYALNIGLSFNIKTGIGDASMNTLNFNIYPNPFSASTTIETNSTKLKQIQLFDISGRLMKFDRFNEGKYNLRRGPLSRGIYLLSISENNKLLVIEKLIIE